MRTISFIGLLLIAWMATFGQSIERKKADSLLRVLSNIKPGSERINILIHLAQFHIFKPGENQIDFDSAMTYLSEARRLNEPIRSLSLEGQLLLTESFMLREKGQKNAAISKVEEAIKTFQSSDDKYYLGKALYELSGYYGYDDSAENIKKVNLVERSVDAFKQSNGVLEKAEALKMLGDLYDINDNFDKSIEVLTQALDAYNSINYRALQGVYELIGDVYLAKEEYKEAFYYELQAIKTAESCRDTTIQLCQINIKLGTLYGYSARYDLSLKYFKEALRIAINCNDGYAVALAVYNVAKTYGFLERPEGLLAFMSGIPSKFLDPTASLGKAFFAMSYMQGYLGTRQFKKAEYYCDMLLNLVDEPGVSPSFKNIIYRLAASYYLEIKQFSKTRFYLSINKPISKKLGSGRSRALSLDEKLWYKFYAAQGNYDSAYNHLLICKTISDTLFNETKARQFQQLEVEYETAKKTDSLKSKDQLIGLLTQKTNLQQLNLRQSNLIKNITIVGIIFTLIVLGLLFYQFRNNQRSNKIILQKNEQLKDMLAEKEWWLKEVHHRVKNNLHTIICLLESQAMYLEKDALQAIEKSQHRIYAMSLIHQKLYQNEDLQVIDMSIYLEEFIGYLKDSFDTNNIEFIIKVEPVQLNLQQAIPVALIINEGVTNAIKYAFGNESGAKIRISMTETDATVRLTITDNGRGFEWSEDNERKSLGMQLIKGLSKELKGTVLIESKDGTKLSIVFQKGPLTDQIPSLQEDNIGR
jgi:two-component system, sensor histidine kinase PdtaS